MVESLGEAAERNLNGAKIARLFENAAIASLPSSERVNRLAESAADYFPDEDAMKQSGRPSVFAHRAMNAGFRFFAYISSFYASAADSNTGSRWMHSSASLPDPNAGYFFRPVGTN
jgi:hypothetical protein